MAEVLVLVHFTSLAPIDPPAEEGVLGTSLWRLDEGPGEVLVALHFSDAEAADRHLKAIVETSLDASDDALPLPSVVHHLEVEKARGLSLEEAEIGSFAVFGRFVAEPGYQDVARSRAEEILPTFGQLPGFRGYAFGHNRSFADEAMVVLLWSDRPPFPMPEDVQMHVETYRRIA